MTIEAAQIGFPSNMAAGAVEAQDWFVSRERGSDVGEKKSSAAAANRDSQIAEDTLLQFVARRRCRRGLWKGSLWASLATN